MKSMIYTAHKGFIALIAVLLISLSALAFSLVALSAAVMYSDSVTQRELRIQKGLNEEACSDTLSLMKAKDYFLNGRMTVPELGCE